VVSVNCLLRIAMTVPRSVVVATVMLLYVQQRAASFNKRASVSFDDGKNKKKPRLCQPSRLLHLLVCILSEV